MSVDEDDRSPTLEDLDKPVRAAITGALDARAIHEAMLEDRPTLRPRSEQTPAGALRLDAAELASLRQAAVQGELQERHYALSREQIEQRVAALQVAPGAGWVIDSQTVAPLRHHLFCLPLSQEGLCQVPERAGFTQLAFLWWWLPEIGRHGLSVSRRRAWVRDRLRLLYQLGERVRASRILLSARPSYPQGHFQSIPLEQLDDHLSQLGYRLERHLVIGWPGERDHENLYVFVRQELDTTPSPESSILILPPQEPAEQLARQLLERYSSPGQQVMELGSERSSNLLQQAEVMRRLAITVLERPEHVTAQLEALLRSTLQAPRRC